MSPKNIFAETHNHNGHHQKEITSPFEVKKEKTSLHCLLKLHALNEPCPHSNPVKDKSISFTIASDCGGKTSGGLLNTISFNYDFTEIISISIVTNDLTSGFTFEQLPSYYRLNDSIPPPPKVI
jgi:hypothetical protein